MPAASVPWTLAPQLLVGLGLGLSIDSLTAAALRDRVPRALHGGWTIAARHAGVVLGLAILTPIFTADLRRAETPAKEAVAGIVLDAPLPATTKLELADSSAAASSQSAAGCRISGRRSRACGWRRARSPPPPRSRLTSRISFAAPRRGRLTAFLVAALIIGLLAVVPAAALTDRRRSATSAGQPAPASSGGSGP